MVQDLIAVNMAGSDIFEIEGDGFPGNSILTPRPEDKVTRADTGLIKGLVGNEDIKIGSQVVVFGLFQSPEKGSFRVFPDKREPGQADGITVEVERQ